MQIKPTEKILEIGYGPGAGIQVLANKHPDVTIDGIDFSPLMYKKAKSLNKRLVEKQQVSLRLGDFLEPENYSARYNHIFCGNVIYFLGSAAYPFPENT